MFELLSIPAILALVEAFKLAGFPKNFAALLSIFCGIVFGLIIGDAVTGLIIGLAASGLYSGSKNIIKG